MADPRTLQELLAATARGDHAAFTLVYERTHAHLFGVAVRMLGREHAAEDVLQEAFVNVWRNAAQYRSSPGGVELQPMTWLIAIVRNKALDALRSRKREPESLAAREDDDDAGDAAPSPSALDLLARASSAMQVGQCLESLDGSHRQSLALAFYQGLTHTEVAAQMNAPLGSVKAWIRRGLDKLRMCLEAGGFAA